MEKIMKRIFNILLLPIFSLILLGCTSQNTEVEKPETLKLGELTSEQLNNMEYYDLDMIYRSDVEQEKYDEIFYMIDSLFDIADSNIQDVVLKNAKNEQLKPYEDEPLMIINLEQGVKAETLREPSDYDFETVTNQLTGTHASRGYTHGIYILDKSEDIYKKVHREIKENNSEKLYPQASIVYETEKTIIYYSGVSRPKVTDLVLSTLTSKEAMQIYKEYIE